MSEQQPAKQPSQELVSTPTMRYQPLPIEEASAYVGMDQLNFFFSLVECFISYLDERAREHFWQAIRERCPELMQAIESDRIDIKSVVFTWELRSRAFDLNIAKKGNELS